MLNLTNLLRALWEIYIMPKNNLFCKNLKHVYFHHYVGFNIGYLPPVLIDKI